MRETEEKKELLKRKREQGKRWFTKPERLDRQNEKRGKAAARSEVLSPLEHTGVSSEVRHFSLELGFPVFWPPQNVHPAVTGTPHLSRKKSPLSRKEKKTRKRAASKDQTKTGRRPDKDQTTTKTKGRQALRQLAAPLQATGGRFCSCRLLGCVLRAASFAAAFRSAAA